MVITVRHISNTKYCNSNNGMHILGKRLSSLNVIEEVSFISQKAKRNAY